MRRKIHDWPTTSHWHAPAPGSRGPDGPDGELPGRARWVLALGIVSLMFGPLGVIAWMAGNACLRAIEDGRMDPTCESNARAGRLLGIIAICMFGLKLSVLVPVLAWYQIW